MIRNWRLILEPGRSIVGSAGLLLTRVIYLKQNNHRHFAIVDAGSNDLLRPSLYNAWHPVLQVQQHHNTEDGESKQVDVVGPICESGDVLAADRQLTVQQGDLLAIDKVGAYGFSMSSNYNSRLRPAEVMISGSCAQLVRRRQRPEDLWRDEVTETEI